jgi:hypothetical protein
MRSDKWIRYLSALSGLTGAVLGLLLFTGCASESPISPEKPSLTFSGENVPFAWAPDRSGERPLSLSGGFDDWHQVASAELGSAGGVLAHGRWTLIVPQNAWNANEFGADALFTMEVRDEDLLDVRFGPYGIAFTEPVTVVIDYSGTNVDPDSPNYDGTFPVFFYYNAEADQWEPFQLINNESAKTVTIELGHFSRYALLGTPGW